SLDQRAKAKQALPRTSRLGLSLTNASSNGREQRWRSRSNSLHSESRFVSRVCSRNNTSPAFSTSGPSGVFKRSQTAASRASGEPGSFSSKPNNSPTLGAGWIVFPWGGGNSDNPEPFQ